VELSALGRWERGAVVHVVGPTEGWRSLSIPSNTKEPEAHMRMAGVFPSPAATAFPGKSSGKRMAQGIQETGVDGIRPYLSHALRVFVGRRLWLAFRPSGLLIFR
jgi:hypothetical protein